MEKILIIGGSNFIGRNLIERLIKNKNNELTLLNRGITNSNLFPSINKLIVDRNTKDIAKIVKGNWDYVIDLSCYFPSSLEFILSGLSNTIKKYIFISTCSVYELDNIILKDESAPLKTCNKENYYDQTTNSYGERKVACEGLITSSGHNYTILRPALVFGKYDHTDRFYYWLHQVKHFDHIAIANDGIQKFSLTYVQDLIDAIEQSIKPEEDKNVFNIVSHPEISIKEILAFTSKELGRTPDIISMSDQYLSNNNVTEWVDLPLWLNSNFFTFSNDKMKKFFHFDVSDLKNSIKDTIQYYEFINWPAPIYGLSRSKQLQLIQNFR